MVTVEEQNKIIRYKKLYQDGDIDLSDLREDIRERVIEAVEEERRRTEKKSMTILAHVNVKKLMDGR